ncbi:hypothetical protein Tco_0642217 [Tanacetum coccineum]
MESVKKSIDERALLNEEYGQLGTLNFSAGTSFNPKKEGLRVWLLKRPVYLKAETRASKEFSLMNKQCRYCSQQFSLAPPMQKTSDHDSFKNSEFRHSNELSKFKAGSKSLFLQQTRQYITTELDYYFPSP